MAEAGGKPETPTLPLNLPAAIATLLLCQLGGEVIVLALRQVYPVLAFPGPVVGMALMFLMLLWRKGPGASLDASAGGILRNLSLLFVPAAVGIVQYGPVLAEFGLTLGQVATEEKSNEITAIPELLKLIDLKGSVITIDAMGTQVAIAEQIVDGEGDFILALKANQNGLFQQVMNCVEDHITDDFVRLTTERLEEPLKKSHGRVDTRMYLQFEVPNAFTGTSRWKGLKTIGMVVYKSMIKGEERIDIRYFISSLSLDIAQFSKAVRGHWGIETTCHWSLDVTYGEDGLRTRQRTIAENLAWLRRFTLSLLKQHPGKDSLAMKRRICGWNDDFLMQVLGINAI